jgi:phosphoribosylanthranilate isomerase
MFVKICANTNLEDALLAVELGADAVGFVFAKSPRQVSADLVASITSKLPDGIERIGVFSDEQFEDIPSIFRAAGLSGVQLHGGYSEFATKTLRDEFGPELRIIQTNHWRVGGQVPAAFGEELRTLRLAQEVDAVLVDSRTAVADGGTGVTFDWDAARNSIIELGEKPLIVAGGLNTENVAEAIATLRPWGVDVASGVEAVPGKKDAAKLRAFIAAARAAATR